MSAVVMDSGKKRFLDFLTSSGGTGLLGVKAHLFTNNVTPNRADLLSTYTEAAWTGYASQTLSGWAVASLDGTFHALSTASPVIFNNGSAGTVSAYGYFVTDSGGTNLLYAERFAAPPVSILAAQSLTLTCTFTDTSEF